MTDLYGVKYGLIFIGKRETYITKKGYKKKKIQKNRNSLKDHKNNLFHYKLIR